MLLAHFATLFKSLCKLFSAKMDIISKENVILSKNIINASFYNSTLLFLLFTLLKIRHFEVLPELTKHVGRKEFKKSLTSHSLAHTHKRKWKGSVIQILMFRFDIVLAFKIKDQKTLVHLHWWLNQLANLGIDPLNNCLD